MTGAPDPPDQRTRGREGSLVTRTADPRASLLRLALEAPAFTFSTGDAIGPFDIVRPLGRGGMGEVYEVEDRASGRRLALKLLCEPFDRPADRDQFLREGRLAATIRDPHTVYVFGTYDFDGVLAIGMELVHGGTLRDLVTSQGALPIVAAVDAILQVIDGLEAAAAAGVLHRDVKPSNCFVDGDGTIKVGDFGLSIDTSQCGDTLAVAATPVLATPEFASPEQLRGSRVDHSSDVYSTAATLYFLLCGRPPVAGESLAHVIARVLGHDIEPLRQLRPDVPASLARVVTQCLSSQPSARLTFGELRRQLIGHSSAACPPANPAIRMCAAIVDAAVLTLPLEWVERQPPWSGFLQPYSPSRLVVDIVVGLVYFSVLEGCWGASIGKAVGRLHVTRTDGRPPGWLRATIRAAVYQGAWLPLLTLLLVAPVATSPLSPRGIPLQVACVALLGLGVFVTARPPRFMGLHERASGTQVVTDNVAGRREPPAAGHTGSGAAQPAVRLGPFLVSREPSAVGRPGVVWGYDPMLHRSVWVQYVDPSAPEIPAWRRDLQRPGRPRWLCGRRTPGDSWDAYDAPEGTGLTTWPGADQSWSAVRFWLVDLAEEIQRTSDDAGGEPVIDADRIWLTSTGRAMLLDFAAPGAPGVGAASTCRMDIRTAASVQPFLYGIATRLLSSARPLPLQASALLNRLERSGFADLGSVAVALRALLHMAPELARRRRLTHLTFTAAIPALAAAAGVAQVITGTPLAADRLIAPVSAALFLMAGVGVWSAGVSRGGVLLHTLGIAVARQGKPASRPRALLRALAGWMPAILLQIAIGFGAIWLGVAIIAAWFAAAVIAAACQLPGVHDRIAGTYLTAP